MDEKVGLVLAGGGARGAYEIGALSVLLPVLEERGERPEVIVGTSVGALNAAYLASRADQPAGRVVDEGRRIWEEIRYQDVLRSLFSREEAVIALRSVAEALSVPGATPWSLLDPTPLGATLKRLIAFRRIRANVMDRSVPLSAAAVVTTAAHSSRSVVFHDGGGRPRQDVRRGIEYIATTLGEAHVRASAAIPVAFPAVRITTPTRGRGWYFDGGTRLNTPIKPALALGARRVVVIALNSVVSAPPSGSRADVFDGASELVQAVLVDPLVQDVHTLAAINEAVASAAGAGQQGGGRYVPVRYIFVAPQTPNRIGELAAEVYSRDYSGIRGAVSSRDLALLGRVLDAARSPIRGELFSYLFFAAEFAAELIKLGREDAKRWLRRKHDDGPWRLRPLPIR